MREQFRSIKSVVAVAALVMAMVGVALAQSGHFVTGGNNAPVCEDIGAQVSCSGKVAGLGGTTFEITVEATGVAIVECENPGGNVAPGQDTEVEVAGSSGELPTPRNGQYSFEIATVEPVVPNYPTCPNPQWSANVVDVIFGDATMTLFEDGVPVDEVVVPVQ